MLAFGEIPPLYVTVVVLTWLGYVKANKSPIGDPKVDNTVVVSCLTVAECTIPALGIIESTPDVGLISDILDFGD